MFRVNTNEMLGEYKVAGFLGKGGMGEVYYGVHAKLGRPAAIKVLASDITDESFTTRFVNEARLQASLHHPNIAALYDFQEINGQLVIFMEFVDGEPLDELIRRRAFAVEDALRAFRSLCEAVAFIHSHGIIHRDIKAANAKINSNGTIKLLDFGIAKHAEHSPRLTVTDGIIGTPRYLAPEQLDGRQASPQTDVWALGVLFYEMLTGSPPFRAANLNELYLQITGGRYEPPEKLNPAVSPPVSRLAAHCLKRHPAERFASAAAVAAEITEILESRRQPPTIFPRRRISRPIAQKTPPPNFISEGSLPAPPSDNAAPRSSNFAVIGGAIAVCVLLLAAVIVGWRFLSDDANGVSQAQSNINLLKPKGDLLTIKVEVLGSGGAQVWQDGKKVGDTPYSFQARVGERVELTLKRDNFKEKKIPIVVSPNKKLYSESLEPIER